MTTTTEATERRGDTAAAPRARDRNAHLHLFPGEPWAFWKWCGVRGAGLPGRLTLNLASAEAAREADLVLAFEREVEMLRRRALKAIDDAFQLPRDRELRKLLDRTFQQIKKGRTPEITEGALGEACRALNEASEHLAQKQAAYETIQARADTEISAAIREAARHPLFLQAMSIQNRGALTHVLHSFEIEQVGKANSRVRQHEELVASYLQRYSLKNDTIGFFGPVGWARFGSDVDTIEVVPGPQLVAQSLFSFENWSIETLGEKLTEDLGLRPWIAPRLLPTYRFDGHDLYGATGAAVALTPLQLAVLRSCNNQRTAREIAEEVANDTGHGEEATYHTLDDLAKRKIVAWAYELPLTLNPERALRQLLERVGDHELRERALEILARLERARDEVSDAFGDPVRLNSAIAALETTFEEATGNASNRLGGKMYAGRTLFYQDCRRDVQIDIGPGLLDALMPPLSLLLASARWFSSRVAEEYRRALVKAHAEMAHATRSDTVEFIPFLRYVQATLFSMQRPSNMLTPVVEELQSRWKRIFASDSKGRHLQFRSEDVKPMVDDLFAAKGPGWQRARHHCPDLMIAASSVDAIRRGDFLFVLGEAHITSITIDSSLYISQHPRPADIFDALTKDYSDPLVNLIFPRSWPRVTNRTMAPWTPPYTVHIESAADTLYGGDRSQVVAASALVVKNFGDGIVVCSRDSALELDPIECFGNLISMASVLLYDFKKVFANGNYSPRVTIDRMVVARESWTVSAADIPFVREKDKHLRYLAARRWMQERQLPRFVFYKVPVEVKPCYLDFDSPVYVEIFAKMIRRVLASDKADGAVHLSEMLPGHDDLWLPDAQGEVYTSELRIVAKDLFPQAGFD